ncbi:MAG TPA: hypothetical protein PLJ12_02120 [Planctomycetota bacterium]|nr:hypothetical protein [Planctomycetota bacterium]
MRHSLTTALLLLGAGTTLAQGPDCSNATPIQSTGQWGWWGSGAVSTSEFSPGTDCVFFEGHTENYFQWTATSAGNYQIDTLGSTWDTQLAVYGGSGCNATCLDYDYGTGSIPTGLHYSYIGLSILVLENVQAGDTYLIRVGNQPESHTPWIELAVGDYTDPCLGLTDDAFEDNDRLLQASDLGDGTYAGLGVSLLDPDYYEFCVDPGGTLQVDLQFTHALGNIDAKLVPVDTLFVDLVVFPVVYGTSTTDNESLTYTNVSARNARYRLEVYVYGASTGSDCNSYDLVVAGTGACAFASSTFCDPMDPNSTGQSTTLTAVPSTAAGAGLRLEASQGPPGQFAYLLVGSAVSDPGLALGGGRFCLAVTNFERYGRYNISGTPMDSLGRFQPNGQLGNIVGTSSTGYGFDLPETLPFLWWFDRHLWVNAGQTWHFQLWHREPGGQSNFSNGLSIAF